MGLAGTAGGDMRSLQFRVSVGRKGHSGLDAYFQVDRFVLVDAGQEFKYVAALVEIGGFLGAFLGIFGRAGTLRGYPRRSAF